jgi:cell division protein FtsQ
LNWRWKDIGRKIVNYNPPNTRERIAARRQARQKQRGASGSKVRPGPRRALGGWLVTGRLFSLALFIAVMGALAYLFTASRFTVQRIDVVGNTILKADTVIEAAALRDVSIWFAHNAGASQRLLQNLYIERVSVQALLPDRVTIAIVERRPEVHWQLDNVQYLVDSNGKVLGIADETSPPLQATEAEQPYLVIMDTSRHVLQPNDQIDPDALRLAQTLNARLSTELNMTSPVIGWDYALGVYVKTGAGQTIVFGQSENLERKLAVLQYLLNDQTVFTYLDLRPSNPYYQNAPQAVMSDQAPTTNNNERPTNDP